MMPSRRDMFGFALAAFAPIATMARVPWERVVALDLCRDPDGSTTFATYAMLDCGTVIGPLTREDAPA